MKYLRSTDFELVNAFRFGHDRIPDWFWNDHLDKITFLDESAHRHNNPFKPASAVVLETTSGATKWSVGDWVIQKPCAAGPFSGCDNDYFNETYKPFGFDVGTAVASTEAFPEVSKPVLAEIVHAHSLGMSTFHEVIYHDSVSWHPYVGSSTFRDGEIVKRWVYVEEAMSGKKRLVYTPAKPPYDSTLDTLKHIAAVRRHLDAFAIALIARGDEHDASKLEEPEKSVFDQYRPLLKALKYGSDEYKANLEKLKLALKHHYEHNRHHPEHFGYWLCLGACGKKFSPDEVKFLCPECGCSLHYEEADINSMNLFDIVEMLMDWKVASDEQDGGDIRRSLEINTKRFKIGEQLKSILAQTIEVMGW